MTAGTLVDGMIAVKKMTGEFRLGYTCPYALCLRNIKKRETIGKFFAGICSNANGKFLMQGVISSFQL
ncbi:MAG: hypothetical protein QM757_26370 [Paludibaculum sp.]